MLDRLNASAAEKPAPVLERDLHYVSDSEPGIQRLRCGAGFRYKGVGAGRVSAGDIERIKALAIPPAWQDVWICANPNGHIQATGRDLRGRKQYRYHCEWSAMQGETKFSSLGDFATVLSSLRRQVEADMRRRSLCREKVIATIVWLMDRLLVRVGSPDYARSNKSFGVTTLRNRHLKNDGSSLRLIFKGKSGKDWNLKISDRRIATIIRSLQELPGQHLFQYVCDEGKRHAITSQDINDYLRDVTKADFTSKHFRTWAATASAVKGLSVLPRPETAAASKRALNAQIDRIAQRLCNTRAVCRRSYIHPLVFEQWEQGHLAATVQAASRLRVVAPQLDQDERIALKWLRHVGTTTRANDC
ncbi:DNA topoisomerase IB [Brucella pituitosa]|uniref:DNA topoisomerase IB n=1 Tax=Brucella pituitosa TaxID=571256 RepID=UPI0009A1657B|nr:DNA topoisomerase IB [Brucella pituitosa]